MVYDVSVNIIRIGFKLVNTMQIHGMIYREKFLNKL